MKVELKSIKEIPGDETPCFQATLYLEGVKAAIVSNSGRGGCNHYHWFDQKAGKSALCERFLAYAKEQNPNEKFEVMDTEIFAILDAAANAKKLKRLCATKTLARLFGETYKKGEYSVFNVKFTPKVKAELISKYPGITFGNEGL
jgi:hypothetical protein